VIDINVFVSAIMAPGGTPRHVLRVALLGEIVPVVGNALFREYEDVFACWPMWKGSSLDRAEREALLNAVMGVSLWIPVYFLWRPSLPDEGDNHVLELAVAGDAGTVITANKRDFGQSDLCFLSVRIKSAGEFLERRKR